MDTRILHNLIGLLSELLHTLLTSLCQHTCPMHVQASMTSLSCSICPTSRCCPSLLTRSAACATLLSAASSSSCTCVQMQFTTSQMSGMQKQKQKHGSMTAQTMQVAAYSMQEQGADAGQAQPVDSGTATSCSICQHKNTSQALVAETALQLLTWLLLLVLASPVTYMLGAFMCLLRLALSACRDKHTHHSSLTTHSPRPLYGNTHQLSAWPSSPYTLRSNSVFSHLCLSLFVLCLCQVPDVPEGLEGAVAGRQPLHQAATLQGIRGGKPTRAGEPRQRCSQVSPGL